MKREIYIKLDERLTLEQYLPIAADTMSFIAEAAEGVEEIEETFSVSNLSVLLNEISKDISGEFEVCQMPSTYCQIVYMPFSFNGAAFDEESVLSNIIEMPDAPKIHLWVNGKVLTAFIDKRLHEVAIAIYFYLGYLMTHNSDLALSHNISFEKILESCDALTEKSYMKYRTTLMRILADLEDAELIEWDAENRTFEVLHITPYDPATQV